MRLKPVIFSLLVLAVYIYALPFYCWAQATSSTELINNAKQYDGKLVVYEGEVIGDVMRRGDYAWINLNDSYNAIGIWIKTALTNDIAHEGSYKAKGDWIEVTGIFHRACHEHGGDLDIHAQSLRKISSGRYLRERLNPGKKDQAAIFLGILGFVWILTLLKQK